MKTKKYLLLALALFLTNSLLNSQEKIDSLTYYKNMIDQNAESSILAKAYVFINPYKEKSLEDGDILSAAYYLDYMSQVEFDLGLFFDSERTIVQGLELLDSLGRGQYQDLYRYRFLNRQGLIYWEYNQYEESLKSFSQLLKLVKGEKSKGILYNNLGATYKHLEKYDSARFYLETAYKINKNVNDTIEKARSLDNLGFVKGMQGLKDGEGDMMSALKIRNSLERDLYPSYWHLTKYYRSKGNISKAKKYAYKAYSLAVRDKSNSFRFDALRNLLELGLSNHLMEYLELSDEITEEKQTNENKFAKAKYDYSREQVKAAKAELEVEKIRFQTIIYFILGAFIFLTLIGVIILLRVRHRKKLLIKQFETEQHISKKLHDEVANDVFHNLTKMRRDPSISKELLAPLDQVYDKIRDISKTHADLDVNTDFGRLLNDLILSYKTQDVNIFTKNSSKMVWQEVSEAKRKVLYRVIQELMVNMKKHSQASLVTIKFAKERGKLHIEYIDNGVGAVLEKGSGLRNTESRMELVGGKISFTSELGKGFQANLIL